MPNTVTRWLSISVIAATLFLLVGSAHAGTVTLTGTCQNYVAGNSIQFGISNSGNDTAYNMVIVPYIQNATAERYVMSSLKPGVQNNTIVTLSNVTARGTYADYFVATYQQGSSFFTAIFPCLLNFRESTQSQISIYAHSSSGGGNTAEVSVKVYNSAESGVSANVFLILPPQFANSTNMYQYVSLSPYQTKNLSFLITFPSTSQNAYTVGAAASYVQGNLHFTSLSTFSISMAGTAGEAGNLVLAGAISAIVVVAALIMIVFARKILRRPPGKKAEAAKQE